MDNLVAIYTRVSSEDLETPLSTRRQERACRIFAESKGWEVADIWEDVDVSAYQRGVRRPAFEDLLARVAGGTINGVLVWKLDRLVRRTADFEKFWVRCDQAGVFLASVTEPIDSTTDLGLAVIRILVTFAKAESATLSLRLKSVWEQRARSGIPVGKGRHFGFTTDGHEIVEDEGHLIQEAVERVLGGDTPTAIARDWHERGITTPLGGAWGTYNMAKLLGSPRLVGDNALRGTVMATDCFPAILDRLTHARVRSAMAGKLMMREPVSPYLLKGLLRCGRCGRTLGMVRQKPRRATAPNARYSRSYRCQARPCGCAGISINADFIENLIVKAVLGRLERRPRLRPRLTPPAEASERLAAAYDRHAVSLRNLATDYYVEHRLSQEEWQAGRNGLEHQLNEARRRLDPQWRPVAARKPNRITRFRAEWDSFDLAHQRDIISSELEYATIVPARVPGVLDARRVQPTWWDDNPELTPEDWTAVADIVDTWNPEVWMSTAEAANELNCSREHVDHMVGDGVFNAERLGRHFRLRRSDVAEIAALKPGSLKTGDVARTFGVCTMTVANWVQQGLLPLARPGRRGFTFTREDVKAFGNNLRSARRQLIGTPEAARLLKTSPMLLRREIDAGTFPAIRHGTAYRVSREYVEAEVRRRKKIDETTMSALELATALKVDRGTVLRDIWGGRLRATMIRHSYRISVPDLIRAGGAYETVGRRKARSEVTDHPVKASTATSSTSGVQSKCLPG